MNFALGKGKQPPSLLRCASPTQISPEAGAPLPTPPRCSPHGLARSPPSPSVRLQSSPPFLHKKQHYTTQQGGSSFVESLLLVGH